MLVNHFEGDYRPSADRLTRSTHQQRGGRKASVLAVNTEGLFHSSGAGLGSRPDPAEHELVDLVSAHAYKRDGIDLLVGQATSSKRASLVRCESLDFMGRLRLIGVDRSESPEAPSPCDGKWKAVIAETLGLQA